MEKGIVKNNKAGQRTREGVVRDVFPEKVAFELRTKDAKEGAMKSDQKEECPRQR